jgi:hypothetical protein
MDIQHRINEARETMLTNGNGMPMISLDLSEGVPMLALEVLSDAGSSPAQSSILARLGWETCKKYPGQQPFSLGIRASSADMDVFTTTHQNPHLTIRERREMWLLRCLRQHLSEQKCLLIGRRRVSGQTRDMI